MKSVAFSLLMEERERDALLDVVYRLQRSPGWKKRAGNVEERAVDTLRKSLERTRQNQLPLKMGMQ